MAVIAWNDARVKYSKETRLGDGAHVSVSVWKDGTAVTLRFKRTQADGSWPTGAGYTFGAVTANEPWDIKQYRGGLLATNGKGKFYVSKSLAPTSSGDWTEATVMP